MGGHSFILKNKTKLKRVYYARQIIHFLKKKTMMRFGIKSASKFKCVITTDLPSARAHHFKSVEQDFSIEFSLNSHYPFLEMRIWIVFPSCFRHAIVIVVWFLAWWLCDSFLFWSRFHSKFTKWTLIYLRYEFISRTYPHKFDNYLQGLVHAYNQCLHKHFWFNNQTRIHV